MAQDSKKPEEEQAEGEESHEPEPEEPQEAEPEAEENLSRWQKEARRAQELWEAGNNLELRKSIQELKKAPESEKEALALAAEMERRLKPDPIAIVLWALTFGVLCLLTYLFVLD